jgi:4-diphosphocytidyl-2C-methyl-D-erythritol kinase
VVSAPPPRLGLGRDAAELVELAGRLREVAGAGTSPLAYTDLLANDLEPAARALRPEIGDALDALRDAGAEHTMLTGTGPTAVGVCRDLAAAERVAGRLDGQVGAIVCEAGRGPDGT